MSVLNLSFQQSATLISAVGAHTSVLLQGEPGIGKSSVLHSVSSTLRMPGIYVDCSVLDVGDVQLPHVPKNAASFGMLPNERLFPTTPAIVCLDELGKAPRAVKNALLPYLLERRIGAYTLPAGSVVFATTNLQSDGVGDLLEAHARNRITAVGMRKPSTDEFLSYAGETGALDSSLGAWIRSTPGLFDSYTESGTGDNPYIWNPSRPAPAFVTPRSLMAASRIIRSNLQEDVLLSALAGTIGEAAARQLDAFLPLRAEIEGLWEAIQTDPTAAPVPSSVPARLMVVYKAIERVATPQEATNVLVWACRLPTEYQAALVTEVGRVPRTLLIFGRTKAYTDWVRQNSHIL